MEERPERGGGHFKQGQDCWPSPKSKKRQFNQLDNKMVPWTKQKTNVGLALSPSIFYLCVCFVDF